MRRVVWMLVLMVAGGLCLEAQTPVANLDESRLLGNWFEIARLPMKSQKDCRSDSMLQVARWEKPGTLDWVDSCTNLRGFNDFHNVYARPMPKRKKQSQTSGPGKYKAFTIFPLSNKYLVLGLADDNSWMMIGAPNRKKLWVYAKAREMDPAVYAVAKQVAASDGYDVARLIEQPQNKPQSPQTSDEAGIPGSTP